MKAVTISFFKYISGSSQKKNRYLNEDLLKSLKLVRIAVERDINKKEKSMKMRRG